MVLYLLQRIYLVSLTYPLRVFQAARARDNTDGTVGTVASHPGNQTFRIGETVVWWAAADKENNVATCYRMVVILPRTTLGTTATTTASLTAVSTVTSTDTSTVTITGFGPPTGPTDPNTTSTTTSVSTATTTSSSTTSTSITTTSTSSSTTTSATLIPLGGAGCYPSLDLLFVIDLAADINRNVFGLNSSESLDTACFMRFMTRTVFRLRAAVASGQVRVGVVGFVEEAAPLLGFEEYPQVVDAVQTRGEDWAAAVFGDRLEAMKAQHRSALCITPAARSCSRRCINCSECLDEQRIRLTDSNTQRLRINNFTATCSDCIVRCDTCMPYSQCIIQAQREKYYRSNVAHALEYTRTAIKPTSDRPMLVSVFTGAFVATDATADAQLEAELQALAADANTTSTTSRWAFSGSSGDSVRIPLVTQGLLERISTEDVPTQGLPSACVDANEQQYLDWTAEQATSGSFAVCAAVIDTEQNSRAGMTVGIVFGLILLAVIIFWCCWWKHDTKSKSASHDLYAPPPTCTVDKPDIRHTGDKVVISPTTSDSETFYIISESDFDETMISLHKESWVSCGSMSHTLFIDASGAGKKRVSAYTQKDESRSDITVLDIVVEQMSAPTFNYDGDHEVLVISNEQSYQTQTTISYAFMKGGPDRNDARANCPYALTQGGYAGDVVRPEVYLPIAADSVVEVHALVSCPGLAPSPKVVFMWPSQASILEATLNMSAPSSGQQETNLDVVLTRKNTSASYGFIVDVEADAFQEKRITRVRMETPASERGLRGHPQTGDIIRYVENKAVFNMARKDLYTMFERSGTKLTLGCFRSGSVDRSPPATPLAPPAALAVTSTAGFVAVEKEHNLVMREIRSIYIPRLQSILSSTHIAALFSNWDEIVSHHRALIEELEASAFIPYVLQEHFFKVVNVYTRFFSNIASARAEYWKLLLDSDFNAFETQQVDNHGDPILHPTMAHVMKPARHVLQVRLQQSVSCFRVPY